MLPIFWRVEGWLGQNHDCLLGIAAEVIEDATMPELLHHVPVAHDTSLNWVDDFLCAVEITSILSDGKVKGFSDLFIAHGPCGFGGLITGVGDEGRDVKSGLGVASVAHLGVACSVVDHRNLAIKVHGYVMIMHKT